MFAFCNVLIPNRVKFRFKAESGDRPLIRTILSEGQ